MDVIIIMTVKGLPSNQAGKANGDDAIWRQNYLSPLEGRLQTLAFSRLPISLSGKAVVFFPGDSLQEWGNDVVAEIVVIGDTELDHETVASLTDVIAEELWTFVEDNHLLCDHVHAFIAAEVKKLETASRHRVGMRA